jgi:spore coat polysaccharide biosynthesis protein SpsF
MILAIIQARYSSTRLRGKVLMPILGEPMIARQIERVRRSKELDKIILATSDQDEDTPIETVGRQCGIDVYRGSLNDVLDRYYQAAKTWNPSHVVRITGDCPIIDPAIIDSVVQLAMSDGWEYVSNTIPPTFPDGLDVEVMTFAALQTAWTEATRASDREHVTPFLHRQPERFRVKNFLNRGDLSAMRWTVDEPEDFEFIAAVYEAIYPTNPSFSMEDVLKFIASHPQLSSKNVKFKRNEGYTF